MPALFCAYPQLGQAATVFPLDDWRGRRWPIAAAYAAEVDK